MSLLGWLLVARAFADPDTTGAAASDPAPAIPPTITVPPPPAPDTISEATPAVPTTATRAGEQVITLLVRGVAPDVVVVAERENERVTLEDPGRGVRVGELVGPEARFLQLRLVLEQMGTRRPIYDGLVVLSDRDHETIAFQYQDGEAVRVPVAPSARTEVALDQRATWWISFGWGAVASFWLALLGVLWTRRRRW